MTTLMMIKLVVADLERAKSFYEAVLGVREVKRIQGVVDGGAITELIMEATTPGGAALILFHYHDVPAPAPGECMLVFDTDDVDTFVTRTIQAGGSVMQPTTHLPEFSLTYALVRDAEGHVIEPLCQRTS
jgi:predicted enzyme related to lactoylglutathione lyase